MLKTSSLLFIIASLTIGCADNTDQPENTNSSDAPYKLVYERPLTQTSASPADIEALVNGNTQFAFELWSKVAASNEETAFSPVSIGRAFGHYYGGDGPKEILESTFHFLPDTDISEAAWNGLMQGIRTRESTDPSRDSTFGLSDVYWMDGSGGAVGQFDRIYEIDIATDPDAAVAAINDWVKTESKGLLVDFLEPGALANAYAISTNVVYFQGFWADGFSDSKIQFTGPSGSREVPAFKTVATLGHAQSTDAMMVSIPYTQGYSMQIIQPNNFNSFRSSFDAESWRSLKAQLLTEEIQLTVPDIKINVQPDIQGAIDELRGSDMPTLTGAYQETYVHKVAIKVDESGTTAAAATGIIEAYNNSSTPRVINIDKPFLYLIVDDQSGAILFLGQFF